VFLNRKRWSGFLVIFFLYALIIPSKALPDTNFPLTHIKVDSGSADTFFKKIYESVYVGLSLYKLDAIEKYTKGQLMTSFQPVTGNGLIRFDLKNIDMGKKGWTRYYPFSIGDRNFIMRIFLTAEVQYQPKIKVLYEGRLDDPDITFQILPSLNDILSDCTIKPFRAYSTTQADSSS
jgi:hypothetical protein